MSKKGSTKPTKRAKSRVSKKSKRNRKKEQRKLPVQTYKKGAFKLPEQISTDKSLSPKTPQVAMTLFGHLNKSGYCCLSQDELARLSVVCVTTVRKALRQLEKAGYISAEETSPYFNKTLGRYVRGGHIYRCYIPTTGFIFVPRRILGHVQFGKVQGASVKVYLYIIYRQNGGRAWPSLSMIARDTGLSRKSVCESKKVLSESGLIHFQHCMKKNKAYSCNSYFKLQEAEINAIIPAEKLPSTAVSLLKTFSETRWRAFHSTFFVIYLFFLSSAQYFRQHARSARQGGGVIFALLC